MAPLLQGQERGDREAVLPPRFCIFYIVICLLSQPEYPHQCIAIVYIQRVHYLRSSFSIAMMSIPSKVHTHNTCSKLTFLMPRSISPSNRGLHGTNAESVSIVKCSLFLRCLMSVPSSLREFIFIPKRIKYQKKTRIVKFYSLYVTNGTIFAFLCRNHPCMYFLTFTKKGEL